MDGLDAIVALLVATIRAATPLALAAVGELVTEKSGVLNLGVEGMMLVGAVAAFATAVATGSLALALLAAIIAGMLVALLFAVMTLSLMSNQVATGLALTIFGIGLSAFVGKDFIGIPIESLESVYVPWLSDLPLVGPVLFSQDPLVYASVALTFAVSWFLYRTRPGLVVRAVGENHSAAHAIGYPVIGIRYLCVLFGGAMSGLAGAYLSLAYTPMWVENMTAGRGWIALALVVFATWKPGRVLLGAYLFGGVTIIQLHAQGLGVEVSSHILSMLPYLATIVVLVLISRDQTKIRLNAPACIGKVFRPDH
ncbi:ABC transporter permease [Roseospira marina]|uniref:ABC transporter permease n=1 Tax=Roseospira marina TaxID=140057 RepID=A0A5M6IH12_9PROT|nr:ABC transporter permease [Roseospira marina]KAA5607591.1 ABC transporter permease [Roseospira marina]MBB4312217.1 simple sugar transport system permease protein [Roseospira marina]MBB5085767.1 simple sugar transport system permease protein [Roseospira marina]